MEVGIERAFAEVADGLSAIEAESLWTLSWGELILRP